MKHGTWDLLTHCVEGVLLTLVWKKENPMVWMALQLTLKRTSFCVWLFFLFGAQVIADNCWHCQISSGELPKPFNFPAPAGKWDLFHQPPCKRSVLTRLRAGGLPSAGGASEPCPPAQQNCSFATLRVLLPGHCLPSGLPGRVPAGTLILRNLLCSP